MPRRQLVSVNLTWVGENDGVEDAELGRVHGDLSQAFHEGEVTVEEFAHPLALTRVRGVHNDALCVPDTVVAFQRPVNINKAKLSVLRMVNRVKNNSRKLVIITYFRVRYHPNF